MDFSILLAILGLGVAVISLLKPQTKLSISFKMNWLDKSVIAFSLLFVHYIAFAPILKEFNLLLPLGHWRWGFDEKSATYLIFLLLTAFIVIRLKIAKVNLKNITKFSDLVERLLFEKKYDEVVHLLDNHLTSLFKLVKDNNDDARAIVNQTLTSDELASYIAISKPKFGIKLLRQNFSIKEQFLTLFISALMENKGSQFYYEMANIQTIRMGNRFDIPQHYPLAHYLFSDVTVSEKLRVYKPVGDKIKLLLTEDNQIVQRSNSSFGSFDETERQNNIIECGFHFFEIMIFEAMHQKLTWHMWLYYFPSFSKCILEKLDPTPDVDLEREWPTPYHYYLHRLISINFDWIEGFQNVEGCEAISFNHISLRHDNGSILKSAILSVGQIIWKIIETDKVDDNFKKYCLDTALRNIRDIKEVNVLKPSYQVLIRSLLFNGFMDKKDPSVLNKYKALVDQIDHLLVHENEDFTNLLDTTLKELREQS